jgi:alpha-D-xyloside xylohydrolase
VASQPPMTQRALSVAAVVLLSAACAHPAAIPVVSWHPLPNGILCRMQPGAMEVTLYSGRTVRVHYSPAEALPASHSLAVAGAPLPTEWSVGEAGQDIKLSTPQLRVLISRATGALTFTDPQGTVLLREDPAGGKQMTPVQVAGEEAFRAQQRFVLPPGEALYGLGQHPNGLLDYRGSSVLLRQVNTDVGIPVLVSSRGYGVLWDNPSLTQVDCGGGPVAPIPAGNLLQPDGNPGGLQGEYFAGRGLTDLRLTRLDPTVDFDWRGAPGPGLGHDDFCVRWSGLVRAEAAGEYEFATSTDDGARLWVNGKLLLDDWTTHPAKTLRGRVTLEAGRLYPIRMEFYQERGEAVARLAWRLPREDADAATTWSSEVADAIDYYFTLGPDLDRVVSGYRDLTGAAPLPPRWALGYWQCRERYSTQEELLGVVDEYRRRALPLDGIIQDWFYWAPAPWGSHEFNAERYPDPAAMMQAVHDKHAHIIISVWAKFAPGSANRQELEGEGLLLPTTGPDLYYDPFSPMGRQTYWRQMKDQILSTGVDGWWLDASEPEADGWFRWTGSDGEKCFLGAAARYLNAYPLMHTAGVYQGQRQATPDKRAFILTRSAYAGQQRNAAVTWSGDIAGTWDVFRQQIPAGLNFCLSGIPYWNTDIGGFFGGDPDDPGYRELFVRWFQFGSFCPMFRVHGTGKPKEMWRFGPEVETILARYDRLRYRLLPYLYSLAWRVTSDGYTLMRALPMDFPRDPRAANLTDQYMWGPAIMVSPVTQPGATSREVYLPACAGWSDFWTGERLPGGQTVQAAAPLDTLPLYVRAGSIIPLGPALQYADERLPDPLEIRVYPGADGSFTLYEDTGDGYAYEQGERATIPLAWDDAARTLTVGPRTGSFPGMLGTRALHVVLVAPGHGTGLGPAGDPDRTLTYDGRPLTVTL